MSLTTGFILTDEYGDSIGLTLTEVAAIVGEWDAGCRDAASYVVGAVTIWWETRSRDLCVRSENTSTVFAGPADIAEMRAVLAAQGAP